MKLLNIHSIYFVVFILLGSCKKSIISNPGVASLTVINAAPDDQTIAVNFSDTSLPYYLNQSLIAYTSSGIYSNSPGTTPIKIISSNDTNKFFFSGDLDLKASTIYSLFLTNGTKQADTMLTQDIIPLHTDSSSGVRFVNLSADSHPISINLEGNPPDQTEFSNLGYKVITSFKSYHVTDGISGYSFEIRDLATGELLTTFFWSFAIYKNNTIIISGSEDPVSTTPLTVFQVNNY